MKIIQINSVLNTGSTGRIAEEIGLSLLDKGFDSYIAYGRSARNSKSEIIRIGTDFDFKWHGFETRLLDDHGLASRKATKRFIQKIKIISPDIIHLHNIHGYYLNYPLLFDYLAKAGIPVVWTLHDCWPITGHCAYFSWAKCDKWKTGCFDCPQMHSYPASFLWDNSKKNWELKRNSFCKLNNLTLVPVSNWLSDIMRKSYMCHYEIHMIHNGIDLSIFKRSDTIDLNVRFELADKKILLGVASDWSPRKGLKDFIDLDKLIDHNEYQIILVGLSEKQLKIIPKTIIGISRTESINELAEYYSLATLFLNLTYEDNFPTTNLEALACGTPVLTYNTGGSVEAVTSETGFIVEQGDLSAVLHAINTVTNNGKDYYSSACRKRAEENYNKDDRYQEYIDLYKSLLNK